MPGKAYHTAAAKRQEKWRKKSTKKGPKAYHKGARDAHLGKPKANPSPRLMTVAARSKEMDECIKVLDVVSWDSPVAQSAYRRLKSLARVSGQTVHVDTDDRKVTVEGKRTTSKGWEQTVPALPNPSKAVHKKRAAKQARLVKSSKTREEKSYHRGARDAHKGKPWANPALDWEAFLDEVASAAPGNWEFDDAWQFDERFEITFTVPNGRQRKVVYFHRRPKDFRWFAGTSVPRGGWGATCKQAVAKYKAMKK